MSRIGGPFVFGQTPIVVQLGSGGIFVPQAGNYLASLGGQTAMQWYDQQLNEWRVVAQPNQDLNVFAVDGANWRLVNLSGVVVDLSITNAGSGATANGIGTAATGVSIGFGSAPNPGWAPVAVPIVGGALAGLTLVNAGSLFKVAPLILIDPPPPGGVQATALCTINPTTGVIASVTLVNAGAGYAQTPNVYVLPVPDVWGVPLPNAAGLVNNPLSTPYTQLILQTGLAPNINGAQVTCTGLTGSLTLTGVTFTNYGSGFTGTTIPTVTITGCGAAAATAVMSMAYTGTSGLSGGAGYTTALPPLFETTLGVVKLSKNNGLFSPRVARGVTTVSGGGAVTAFTAEDPGFGFQKVPQLAIINIGNIASAQATATAVVGGLNDVSILQPAVQ